MCPFCKPPCAIVEKGDGRIACACGLHAWPNERVFLETLRRMNLTITGMVHDWTQSH